MDSAPLLSDVDCEKGWCEKGRRSRYLWLLALASAVVVVLVCAFELFGIPSVESVALPALNWALANKVVPTLNREMPAKIREAGKDPLLHFGSQTGAVQITNLQGLSSINIASITAKRFYGTIDPFATTMVMRANMLEDIVADGTSVNPDAQQSLPFGFGGSMPNSLDFKIRIRGLNIPAASFTATVSVTQYEVLQLQILEFPVQYTEVFVQCGSGVVMQALCTSYANRLLATMKSQIQDAISLELQLAFQQMFDKMMPMRFSQHD